MSAAPRRSTSDQDITVPEILARALNTEQVAPLQHPLEQLVRVVGFYHDAAGAHTATSFGSGFFDPARPEFVITSAHALVRPQGPVSSVKIKVYDETGKKGALWGDEFAYLEDHATAGVGADIAVVRLVKAATLRPAALLQAPPDGHFHAYLRAYNTDAGFDDHAPQASTFKVVATKDRLIYQGATATEQMSGAPVIHGANGSVVGVHKGIVGGYLVAARIDLAFLHSLYSKLA